MTPRSQTAELVGALDSAVDADKLVTDPRQLAEYRPGKSPFRELDPGIAVKATSVDDIAAVLRVAGEERIPVVARGGGFSIAGPASKPEVKPIVLDLRALDRILEIDEVNMTVTAECGVIVADLEAAVAERGFEMHTVAVPRAYTTLGGVLSGVFGGGFPSDTGAVGGSGQFLLGLRVVLPNGSILDTNAGGTNVNRTSSSVTGTDGPTLTQVFVGDGGALGVKVQATLAIQPIRPNVAAGGYVFDSFEQAWSVASEVIRIADELPFAKLYVLKDVPWALTYVAKAGTPTRLAEHVDVLERAIERNGGVRGGQALQEYAQANADMDPTWTDQFIHVDRGVIALVVDNRGFSETFRRMRELIEVEYAERLARLGVEPIIFASPYGRHAVWFAITLPYDKQLTGAQEEIVEMTSAAYELAASLGAHNEAHQGDVTGVLASAWSPAYRAFFDLLKEGLDPAGILNAGLWDRP
jgi:FAD/FMN-containing dehydrogenase